MCIYRLRVVHVYRGDGNGGGTRVNPEALRGYTLHLKPKPFKPSSLTLNPNPLNPHP